jgi:hypothetical protein
MALDHEEHRNLIASGLSTIVERLDQVVGNSTWRSAATNVATLKAAMDAQAAPSNIAIHEIDKAGFQTAKRNLDTMVSIGVIDDADIASMNDLATSRAQFEEDDQTLTAHKFGASR